jgi:hypothetical protein
MSGPDTSLLQFKGSMEGVDLVCSGVGFLSGDSIRALMLLTFSKMHTYDKHKKEGEVIASPSSA